MLLPEIDIEGPEEIDDVRAEDADDGSVAHEREVSLDIFFILF